MNVSSDFRQAFASRLALLRGDRSQREFAKHLGVYSQHISKYERGITLPGAAFLEILRETERANLNWLFTGNGARRVR